MECKQTQCTDVDGGGWKVMEMEMEMEFHWFLSSLTFLKKKGQQHLCGDGFGEREA